MAHVYLHPRKRMVYWGLSNDRVPQSYFNVPLKSPLECYSAYPSFPFASKSCTVQLVNPISHYSSHIPIYITIVHGKTPISNMSKMVKPQLLLGFDG
jgi:hypothetical protein